MQPSFTLPCDAWDDRVIETKIGLTLEVGNLRFAPCRPADCEVFKLHYRYREMVYSIVVLKTLLGQDFASSLRID
jgi:hypothetical protein